jgi:hypothetical protein
MDQESAERILSEAWRSVEMQSELDLLLDFKPMESYSRDDTSVCRADERNSDA